MIPQPMIGYVVFDEERPLRRRNDADPQFRYHIWASSRKPIAVFTTQAAAKRVKNMLVRKYRGQANTFDPRKDENHKRCFDLWLKRSKNLRISSVVADNPSAQDLREVKQ